MLEAAKIRVCPVLYSNVADLTKSGWNVTGLASDYSIQTALTFRANLSFVSATHSPIHPLVLSFPARSKPTIKYKKKPTARPMAYMEKRSSHLKRAVTAAPPTAAITVAISESAVEPMLHSRIGTWVRHAKTPAPRAIAHLGYPVGSSRFEKLLT